MERFTCVVSTSSGHQPSKEVLAAMNITDAEKLHFDRETIVQVSRRMEKEGWILLPFCNTLCSEALGAKPVLTADGAYVKEEACKTKEQILQLSEQTLNRDSKRLSVMMQAVQELSRQGSRIAYNIEGPFTILTALMPMGKLFASLRKEEGGRLLQSAANWVVEYAKMAVNNGAVMLSYADPIATVELLGEKMFGNIYLPMCKEIITRIQKENPKVVIHLCGKLSQSLLDIGAVQIEKWSSVQEKSYGELLQEYVKAEPKICTVGHDCLNRLEKKKNNICCMLWNEQ